MPRQPELPGTEDRAIAALEDAAQTYAEIRDQRMALNQRESELKSKLITLMHEHKKTVYQRHGTTIELIEEAETVKVKIKKPGDVEEPATPPSLGHSQQTH